MARSKPLWTLIRGLEMAVQPQTPFKEYTANGTTSTFPLGFSCEKKDHLIVMINGVDVDSITWSLENDQVVFVSAPLDGVEITFQRNTPFERIRNYQSYDNSFRPDPVNKDFDRIWWKVQELGVADWLLGLKLQKFRDDVNLTALENTLAQAQELRDSTAVLADEVEDNAAQSQTLLEDTTAQANAAETSAAAANTANLAAQKAAADAGMAEDNVYIALSAQQTAVNNSLAAIAGGHKAYQTLAAATAAQASLPVNSIVEVTNDSDSIKNGAYQWNGITLTKSVYDPLTQSKNYADANPLFKPRYLVSGEDLNVLPSGIYIVPAASWSTILNMPSSQMTDPDIGIVICNREPTNIGASYQRVVRYTVNANNEIESFERLGNGGSTSFAWLLWQKQVSRYEYEQNKTTINNSIAAIGASKAEINLFPNYALTAESASTYQAALADESGYPTLTMNTSGVTLVAYDMNIVTNIADVGKTISFSADGFCNVNNVNAGDLTIQALNGAGSVIAVSANAYITSANIWQKITTTLTLPAGTTKIRLRMINRNGAGNTVCKFRNAVLMSDYIFIKYINPAQQSGSTASENIFFVAKTGNDSNKGTASAPFLTIQKAVSSLSASGGIIDVSGGVYRETVTSSSKGNVWIRSKRNERAMIFGSNQLIVTKTAGYTQVYQAALAAKPVGMGGGRGKPVIFEFGTLSKPILDSDRHHLHRSRTHRLPYTEMFEAATKAELDTAEGKGKWFWEGGIIYFAATDGSDATLKQYEARMRPTLIQTDGVLHLTRVDTFFSATEGGLFSGILVDREDCRTFGNYFNGWSDNCNITKSLYDEACGNGNDGMNGTVTIYNIPDVNTRLTAHYVEPHVHDNGDDGLSYHYRSNVRIEGGYGEYNTKADFVHVTGATCICDGTESNGTMNGFYIATTATGDSERKASYFKCKNTKARNNTYSYRAADDAIMHCENTKAINPTGFGYYQTGTGAINAEDCKYTGDPSKMKFGTVNVTNHSALT